MNLLIAFFWNDRNCNASICATIWALEAEGGDGGDDAVTGNADSGVNSVTEEVVASDDSGEFLSNSSPYVRKWISLFSSRSR